MTIYQNLMPMISSIFLLILGSCHFETGKEINPKAAHEDINQSRIQVFQDSSKCVRLNSLKRMFMYDTLIELDSKYVRVDKDKILTHFDSLDIKFNAKIFRRMSSGYDSIVSMSINGVEIDHSEIPDYILHQNGGLRIKRINACGYTFCCISVSGWSASREFNTIFLFNLDGKNPKHLITTNCISLSHGDFDQDKNPDFLFEYDIRSHGLEEAYAGKVYEYSNGNSNTVEIMHELFEYEVELINQGQRNENPCLNFK